MLIEPGNRCDSNGSSPGPATDPVTPDGPGGRPVILAWDHCHRGSYYAPLREGLSADWIEGPLDNAAQARLGTPDLVLVSDEHNSATAAAVTEYVRMGAPVLHIADGVIDWNNTWDNPRSHSDNGMPLFQPILSHKIACIGRSQARTLEAWGAIGQCEVVGIPRFDKILGRQRRTRAAGEPFTVVVMTANTPAFTPEQRLLVRQSLADLRDWFARNPIIDAEPVRVVWRLTGGLAEELAVVNTCRELGVADLSTTLDGADAAIVTPSTAILECFLRGIPVASLDYCNRPIYLPTAWVISSAPHLDTVIPQLPNPSKPRMLFQQTSLHDTLECHSPAVPRARRLMNEMIRIGRRCRSDGHRLAFPGRILGDLQGGHHMPEPGYLPGDLHSGHGVFRETDLTRLQAELGHLRYHTKRLQDERDEFRRRALRLHVYERLERLPVVGRAVDLVRGLAAKLAGRSRRRSSRS